jgi:hypothetical protein
MTQSRYSFDDHPEHRDMLDGWAARWIANALSTEPADRPRMTAAMDGLYQAADLTPPPHAKCGFVRSPMTAAVAASVAAGVWWLRRNSDQHRRLFGRPLSETDLMAAVPLACAVAVGAVRRRRSSGPYVRAHVPHLQAAATGPGAPTAFWASQRWTASCQLLTRPSPMAKRQKSSSGRRSPSTSIVSTLELVSP